MFIKQGEGSMRRGKPFIKLAIILTLSAGISISMASSASAADATSAYDATDAYMRGAMHKLGRGISNIVTFPLEIGRMTYITTNTDGFLAGSTAGFAKGVWRGALRGIVGIFETATFFAEVPKNFEPLVKPEFVFGNLTWAVE